MRKLSLTFLTVLLLITVSANLVPYQALAEVTQTAIRERTKELLDSQGSALNDKQRQRKINQFNKLSDTEKCDARRLNIAARQEFYRVNQDEFTDAYEQIYENAKAASARFLELRLDTKKLDNKIANLEDDLFSFKSDYFTLIDNLEENLGMACDDDFDAKNTLRVGLKTLGEMQQGAEEIRKQSLEVLSEMQSLKKIKE